MSKATTVEVMRPNRKPKRARLLANVFMKKVRPRWRDLAHTFGGLFGMTRMLLRSNVLSRLASAHGDRRSSSDLPDRCLDPPKEAFTLCG